MDCEHVQELLDAYALGATEAAEASSVEQHVAECVACWGELSRARETAALISLTVPIHEASARLGERVISQAQREVSPVPTGEKRGVLGRLRLGWPAAAGALGVASVAAIAFGMSMQQQVDDLQAENDALEATLRAETFGLEQQLAETEARVDEQQVMLGVAADEDAVEWEIDPVAADDSAGAHYTYSPDARAGVVECYGMESLPPGVLYQVWIINESGPHPVATFQPLDGSCLVTMSFGGLDSPPTGIGVSTEPIPGSVDEPSGQWVLYTEIPQ